MSSPSTPVSILSIRGAAEHNLKHVDLDLPKGSLIVFTGVSGSGKSSLAFDTIFAEGQRRYVESLSSYARQFLGQMDKPHYDSIRGLSPTIAIEQRSTSNNPRSTVGTVTEILDYLRVLYARAGEMHCPGCGRPVSSTDVATIARSVAGLGAGQKFMILAPVARQKKGKFTIELEALRGQGYSRARIDGELVRLEDVDALAPRRRHDIDVVIDRIALKDGILPRLTDSLETALKVGDGHLTVQLIGGPDNGKELLYSEFRHCSYCDRSLPEPSPQLYSFNSPLGACPHCSGLGTVVEVDLDTVLPDPEVSLRDGAIAPWSTGASEQQARWARGILEGLAARYEIDLDAPFASLPDAQRKVVLEGTGDTLIDVSFESKRGTTVIPMPFEGVLAAVRRRSSESGGADAKYLVDRDCPACDGSRIRAEARSTKVADHTLPQVCRMTLGDLWAMTRDIRLEGNAAIIAAEVLREINNRLSFLCQVGLTYLSLDRSAATLSGGEAQRIRLAGQVGAELSGVLYVLDEPSIGLHPRDNARLLETLLRLRDIGNSVIVVEHDEDTMRAADYLVDFGPGAGVEGGRVVAHGPPETVVAHPESLTGAYLSGRRTIEVPNARRKGNGHELVVRGATHHNLKNIDVNIPLGCLTVVTGVSGAGKSSLINGILAPALSRALHGGAQPVGPHRDILGLEHIDRAVAIDQKPIGRTPRSNPATYTKLWDHIRKVFAGTKESRAYGFSAGRFSFNVKGGRCEACQGAGVVKVEMHFLADVYVPCETCRGRRFNEATLRVHYKGKTIFDILEMSIEEAALHFENHRHIRRILTTLCDVGLGYVALGQAATTLSGGEAQRVKLARELARGGKGHSLYLMDEPSTGLHFEDVRRLLGVIGKLVDGGHTVVLIEHHIDIIKTADHVIDIGPEGGGGGGRVVAAGTPEKLLKVRKSHTGQALKSVLR